MFVAPRCSVEPAAHTSILAPGCDTYAEESHGVAIVAKWS